MSSSNNKEVILSLQESESATLALKPPNNDDLIQDIFILSNEIDEKKCKLKILPI